MNDPKYKFGYNDQLFHREDNYVIPDNEPCMVLRGKDVTSIAGIVGYIKILLTMTPTYVVNSHLNSSIERLKEFRNYQNSISNPGVGCSQEDHSATDLILLEADKLLTQLENYNVN